MAAARARYSATLLTDGRVLLAGGQGPNRPDGFLLASAEVYDPRSGVFSPTGSTTGKARVSATATRLADGRVLVAGGNVPYDYVQYDFGVAPGVATAETYQ